MTVKSTVAEGDKVAVEAASHGQLRNGRVYEQEYHALMTIRNGQIAAVREYLDTDHVLAVWYRR
jgi:ketosteroid isomerase-like protein